MKVIVHNEVDLTKYITLDEYVLNNELKNKRNIIKDIEGRNIIRGLELDNQFYVPKDINGISYKRVVKKHDRNMYLQHIFDSINTGSHISIKFFPGVSHNVYEELYDELERCGIIRVAKNSDKYVSENYIITAQGKKIFNELQKSRRSLTLKTIIMSSVKAIPSIIKAIIAFIIK